ncbi:MFS transporter [Brevibacillus sp. B_LB10_24]|uniref:MFS transporter n=1 Tax=Brevibacillus sp. B_LB10_24 TaxID=3380645 RepID=UPI0038BD257B
MKKPHSASNRKALAWLSILAFFSVLNETVFNVALPDISVHFGIAPAAANWVNTGFILSFAIGTAVYGKLADVYGLKKLLLFGLVTYGTGSLIGLLFHSWFSVLLIARFIQGAGASAVPALIMVMVARYIAPENQGKAFGAVGSVVALGEGVGPVIGGIVADYIHWSYLFALPMITLLSLPFFLRTLPREPGAKGKIDLLGASLLSLGIVMFTVFTTRYHWGYLAASTLFFIGFALRIRHARSPFIEPGLFGRKKYIVGVLTGGVQLGTVAGFISMVPYMMRDVHQLATSLIGGGILFPGTMSVILFGVVGGVLVDKRGPIFAMLAGLCLIAAGFLLISLFPDRSPWLIAGALVLTFGGLSFVKTVVSTCVAEALAPEEAGSGMGLLNFFCFLAEGIGVSVVGGLLTKRWLDFPALPTVTDTVAFLYSNMALLFIAAVLLGGGMFACAYRRRPGASEGAAEQ